MVDVNQAIVEAEFPNIEQIAPKMHLEVGKQIRMECFMSELKLWLFRMFICQDLERRIATTGKYRKNYMVGYWKLKGWFRFFLKKLRAREFRGYIFWLDL